jgi:hypothetical protein
MVRTRTTSLEFVGFSRIFLLGILIFKGLTSRRLYKSFGVKVQKTTCFGPYRTIFRPIWLTKAVMILHTDWDTMMCTHTHTHTHTHTLNARSPVSQIGLLMFQQEPKPNRKKSHFYFRWTKICLTSSAIPQSRPKLCIVFCRAFDSLQNFTAAASVLLISQRQTLTSVHSHWLCPDRRCTACLHSKQVQLVCFFQGRSLKKLEVTALPNTGVLNVAVLTAHIRSRVTRFYLPPTSSTKWQRAA